MINFEHLDLPTNKLTGTRDVTGIINHRHAVVRLGCVLHIAGVLGVQVRNGGKVKACKATTARGANKYKIIYRDVLYSR